MFAQMLFVQWKWSRDLLAFFAVACFASPLIIFWIFMPEWGVPAAQELVIAGQVIGWFCLFFALFAGGVIAQQGYGMDDRAGHVYALTLPVTRSRFLVTRSTSAFVLLAIPALAIWIGGTIAAAQVEIPPSLRTYAGSLALRAVLASWLTHACVLALRQRMGQRLKLAVLVLTGVLIAFAALLGVAPELRSVLTRVVHFLNTHPGPFGVIFGRWTLFDV